MKSTQATTNSIGMPERRAISLIAGEETGGTIAIVELREVAGREPPRHLHSSEDETVFVREGELTFFVGDEVLRVAAGACLFLPRGVEHGYVVESGEASLIVVLTPAGLEGFFEELDTGDGSENLERLIAIAARYGVAITGPAPEKASLGRLSTMNGQRA